MKGYYTSAREAKVANAEIMRAVLELNRAHQACLSASRRLQDDLGGAEVLRLALTNPLGDNRSRSSSVVFLERLDVVTGLAQSGNPKSGGLGTTQGGHDRRAGVN